LAIIILIIKIKKKKKKEKPYAATGTEELASLP
jgi:hypothetical protein